MKYMHEYVIIINYEDFDSYLAYDLEMTLHTQNHLITNKLLILNVIYIIQ